ncbi:MAG: AAA family ATPase [Caldilineaceae bacterium]|nr:AAA family ATPase [Caldilineaceae bacterium]
MKLTKVEITNYKSIWGSNEFEIGDVTCLVGKNESGKTALLQALHKLNPVNESEADFDITMEYPRQAVSQYRRRIAREGEKHDEVVKAIYTLDKSDIQAVQEAFGNNCFLVQEPTLTISKDYGNDVYVYDLEIDEDAILEHLIASANLPIEQNNVLLEQRNVYDVHTELGEMTNPGTLYNITARITASSFSIYIYEQVLEQRVPKFMYFDEYYQLEGQDNLEAFANRVNTGDMKKSDHPLLGLIELAGLEVNDLRNLDNTQTLTAEISAAENELSAMILPYWSQNKDISMKFDLRGGLPGDPEGMREGMNIWGLVVNTRNKVELPINTRSRGFVWFFSFLAWYSNLRRKGEKLILLLDEPGLSLHAKAQEDLLRYIDSELKPHNQILYTTHSPFMVNPHNLEQARIVQDMGMDRIAGGQPQRLGTEIISEIRKATSDTLFPLQAALGYEIYQNLFVGPNCLIVEGVSDLLFIETMSNLLRELSKTELSTKWTITPVGGITNVPTFVALIGAQGNLNLALLLDNRTKDEQKINNLHRERLIRENKILTYADFTKKRESDVEDMFEAEFYLKLVNSVYGTSITPSDLPARKILNKRLDAYLKDNPLPNNAEFNHYHPAHYFNLHINTLKDELSDDVINRWECAFKSLNPLLRQ